MIKSATHNGLTCDFNDYNHTYKIRETGQVLTSVTTIIKQYTPLFDAPAMAQRMVDTKKPAYAGMNAIEIQEQWKSKAKVSSEEGTAVHDYLENWIFINGDDCYIRSDRVDILCKQVDKMFPKLLERFSVVETEKIVFSSSLGWAGQVDMLMSDDQAHDLILIDWKTNAKITDETSAFGNLLGPLKHLKNADVVKYGLQLGIYEKILECEDYYPGFNGYRKALIHLREIGGKVVKVKDYRKEIKKMVMKG